MRNVKECRCPVSGVIRTARSPAARAGPIAYSVNSLHIHFQSSRIQRWHAHDPGPRGPVNEKCIQLTGLWGRAVHARC